MWGQLNNLTKNLTRAQTLVTWGVYEMGSSGDDEFRRWGVQDMRSSGDGEFMRWGVQEMGSL